MGYFVDSFVVINFKIRSAFKSDYYKGKIENIFVDLQN